MMIEMLMTTTMVRMMGTTTLARMLVMLMVARLDTRATFYHHLRGGGRLSPS